MSENQNSKVGKVVLNALDTILNTAKSTKKTKTKTKATKEIPTTENIKLALKLLSKTKDLTNTQAIKTLKFIVKESKKEISKNRKKRKTKDDEFGTKLISEGIPEIAEIFENEPIDEMGTVALFCALFCFIRNKHFKFRGEYFSFESIKFVRTPFPDSAVRIKKINNGRCRDIQIEFEFESYNFIKHKHLEDSKLEKCELIVCWKDNIIGNGIIPLELKKKLPNIIEISDILKTGEINVKNIIDEEKKISAKEVNN